MNRILLTGFEGKNNSSDMIIEKVSTPCRKLILPDDKEKSAELLHKTLGDKGITCVVMLGQKPCIKRKIAVEPEAGRNGDVLHTSMDCTVCVEKIRALGYDAYISRGCGNSYCNNIYYECLGTGVNCIFLHVPTMDNIPDKKEIVKVIEKFLDEISGIPAV